MKKNLLIAVLFLIPFCGFSQTTKPIDGFLGIKFGSTKAAVTAAIKARGGKLNEASKGNNLAFDNVSLGHRKVDFLIVRFIDDKAFEADFTFTPQDDNHAVEYYNGLVSDINEIYGKGESTKKFTSAFKDGDGHELAALITGAAEFNTLWQAANENNIEAKIIKTDDNDLNIELDYQDDKLTGQAVSKQKAQDKGDY